MMANKPLQTLMLDEKEILVQDIMTMAFLANKLVGRCVTIEYAAFVNTLRVVIRESKERYNDYLYVLEICVDRSPAAELVKFRDTLQLLIAEEEVENSTPIYDLEKFRLEDRRNDEPYNYDDQEEEVDA